AAGTGIEPRPYFRAVESATRSRLCSWRFQARSGRLRQRVYAFLSGYTLSRDPGTEFEYSNVGMALLGHVIALKVGTNFESLVVNRICRPLRMDSTRIALTPELKARLAMGHDDSGKPSPPWKLQAYSPAGDVHSTANDLLKYVSAHAGLAPSNLTPLMKETHVARLCSAVIFPQDASPPHRAAAEKLAKAFGFPATAVTTHPQREARCNLLRNGAVPTLRSTCRCGSAASGGGCSSSGGKHGV